MTCLCDIAATPLSIRVIGCAAHVHDALLLRVWSRCPASTPVGGQFLVVVAVVKDGRDVRVSEARTLVQHCHERQRCCGTRYAGQARDGLREALVLFQQVGCLNEGTLSVAWLFHLPIGLSTMLSLPVL